MSVPEFAIGSLIHVRTLSGEEFKGEVFAHDKHTNTLVLRSSAPPETLQLISTDAIDTNSVSELRPGKPGAAQEALPVVDVARCTAKKASAVKAAEAAADRIGIGVTKEGQMIFDALAKTMPVAWEGKTIVVLGEVRVDEPYGVENAGCNPDAEDTLKRVKLVIQAERAKMSNGTV